MGLLRSKSHPRASYASGNRSALWAVENNFRAPKKKKKNLGVRGFMEFGTHKCDSLCAFSARCCAKIRSPLCCSCRHCRVDGGGGCFVLGLRDPVKRTSLGLILGS